jgi:hypothetical protein
VFLEVLSDRAPEEEAGVQTDAHLDRPPEPIFVPQPVRSAPANLARPAALGPLPCAHRFRDRSHRRLTPPAPSRPPLPAPLRPATRSPAWTRRRRSRRATSSTLTSR